MIDPPKTPIDCIPAEAPFSAEQRAWLNGFIAGLFASHGRLGAPPTQAVPALTLTVVYGSQSGTAEALARSFAREAKQRGFKVDVAGMDELDPAGLPSIERLLVLCSTHGDGDPPDNAVDFYRALHAADAPRLDGTAFSVLALGDANYEKFCKCGRDIDRRLEELGATRIFPRVDCDVDVDGPFITWRDGVLAAVAPVGEARTVVSSPNEDVPQRALGPARRVASLVRVLENRNLNAAGSDKETRHIVLGPGQPGPELSYEPGDALAILPFNAPELVDEVIRTAGFEARTEVRDHGETIPLGVALAERFAIGKLTAPVLRAFAERVGDRDWLDLFAPERQADLQAFLHGRELIDLLLAYPRAFSEPAELLEILPRLTPRLYSIASSPRVHPGEIHLTVAAVRYRSHGRERKGVCSTFLAERAPIGTRMLAYIQENRRFRLPEDGDRPVIMIGPGTGIAPFRAFLEERMSSGARGPNWLFFGDRRAATDFLYRGELLAYRERGILQRLDTAFSRDQARKIYVQDRMREQGRLVWEWLAQGAHIYVCGDASRMAKDVEAELQAIAMREGGLDPAGAAAYLQALRKERRYQRDVY
jgi:sulfite reductase (NADPH) flavoprotein alpha-component